MKTSTLLKSLLLTIVLSISVLTYAEETLIPEVSTMEELAVMVEEGDTTGVQVLFKNLEPIFVVKSLFVDVYMPDNKTLINSRIVIPAKFDAVGTYHYNADISEFRFRLDSVANIYSFRSFFYTKEYYEQIRDNKALNTLGVTDPMVVTAVDGANVFVQYQNLDKNIFGDLIIFDGEHNLAIGDEIVGIQAKYSPSTSTTEDENLVIIRNEYFTADATTLGTITHEGKFKYTPINSVSNTTLQNNAADAVKLPSGGTIISEDGKYFYAFGLDTVELKSSKVNFEDYVGKTIEDAIYGVVDYFNTSNSSSSIIVNEIKTLDTNYETIAEWIEAAELGMATGSLKNPVTVTLSVYQSSKSYVFIQDETGALCLDFGYNEVESIKTNDVITGVKGNIEYMSASNTMIAPKISMSINDTTNLKVVGTNEIEPLDVTVAELNADEDNILNNGVMATKYANRLVRIKGLKRGKKWIGNNPMNYPLIQGNDTLPYSRTTLNAFNSKLDTLQSTIVGVIDFQTINASKLYSIFPRSLEDINLVAPEFTPEVDVYEKEVEVSFNMLGVQGVDYEEIYYLIDGEEDADPIEIGERYSQTGAFYIEETATITAVATYPGSKASNIVSATYTIVDEIEIAEPTFTPEAAEYMDSVSVTIACATPKTVILYDLTGNQPNATSPRFDGSAIKLTETTTVTATAFLVNSKGDIRFNSYEEPYASNNVTATYIVKKSTVDAENVEVMAVVYSNNGMIYVDAEMGSVIDVYSVQGQRIYSNVATSNMTCIDANGNNIVLVRVNGETIKVAVK